MRKTMTTMGLGLALTLGAVGAAAAQAPRPDTNRPDAAQPQRGERRRGGPEAMLLRGITLTDAQKSRLEALRREQEPQMKQMREQFGAAMKEARDARERGDTARARARMEQVRTQMERQRDQQIAALRGTLTAEQQKQFDANVAAWKERAARNGGRWMQGGQRGHGDHSGADRDDTR